jgi:hypothetical protein
MILSRWADSGARGPPPRAETISSDSEWVRVQYIKEEEGKLERNEEKFTTVLLLLVRLIIILILTNIR